MKKIIVIVVLAAVVAVAAVVLLRPTADVVAVAGGKAVEAVPGSVVVRAEFQMELKSEEAGRIVKSELKPGRHFARGDFVAQLDPTDVKLAIEKTESDYAAAKKRIAVGSSIALELETAKQDLAAAERQLKAGGMAQALLDKQRRDVQQIEQRRALEEVNNKNQLDNFENDLAVKRRQLAKMTITAPADGTISQVLARPGDLIGGGTSIATLISDDRTVEARISEENFAGIKLGQKCYVRFLGYGAYLFDATVAQILPTADPATQRYIVHLDVKIDPAKLVPGITGEVSIVTAEREAKVLVPRRAIFDNTVFVVEDGRVREQSIEVGYTSLNIVEVLKGLQPGDQVIVDMLDQFHPGQRVKVRVLPPAN
ncbi:efflux RND transporter periplasmic adaptor subunit [Horticoccus luteus]|uniref:Efflux RND transporter periplasmic adaptor subunit n=1 Tax=Horticoccus luteus TaxID=2862869 RepID=A0A8F9XH01_9BACT|nr:efflux RND transporter periplasmic adaptor subunit [Horticoccus luteus]QYM79792.1 efflux RND transporter periplasmic adaptor subunit [Horticoccus luteus]